MSDSEARPRIDTVQVGDRTLVRLGGALSLDHAYDALTRLEQTVRRGRGPVTLDLSGVESIDGGSAALLLGLRTRLAAAGREVDLSAPSPAAGDLLALIGARPPRESLRPEPGSASTPEEVGRFVVTWARGVFDSMGFVGRLTAAAGAVFRRPRSVPWAELPRLAERTGADGLPIVFAINFLVGTTLALQGAIQLRRFGFDVYVADSVALATARSLGPLMTAIIVAGRSGAGFAAELGTMKVSEEIDALRTIGLDPMRYLVIPRILALVFTLPLLTLVADLASILGGMSIGVAHLDLTVRAYVERTWSALSVAHVFSGVLKSVFFGAAIGYIACRRGLATEGGAEGVGKSTTSTVVSIIFALVVLEALFTTLFDLWGI